MPLSIDIDGAGRVVDSLGKLNEEIYKLLQQEVKQAAEKVASYGRVLTPDAILAGGRSSNRERRSPGWGKWKATADGRDLGWDEGKIDRSIKAGARKRRVRGVRGSVGIVGRVYSNDPALAIFATAGAATPDSQFNKDISSKWGAMPTISGGKATRVLGQALIAKGPEAADDIDRALERALARFGLN